MKLRYFIGLIATMVVATSTAGASEIYKKNRNELDVYGNIIGGQYFYKDNMNQGNHMFIRYGISGKTYINDKIIGFSKWEHEFSLNNVEEGIQSKDNSRAMLGYVGIKLGNFGSFDYGRNYGILYDVNSWIDTISDFGGDISLSDNFLSGRASNLVTYRNQNFFGFLDGFNFSLQYQGKNDINQLTGRTVKTANGEGYGVSACYSLKNGFSASVAYANSNRIFEQRNLDSSNINDSSTNNITEAYSVGMKYDAHGAYLAAIYGESYNMIPFGNFDDILNPDNIYGFINKVRNMSVIAQYKFDFGLVPSISYLHSKASDIENEYGNYLKKYVTVGGGYVFNKNLSCIVNYRINLLTKNDFTTAAQVSTDNMFGFGMSYVF